MALPLTFHVADTASIRSVSLSPPYIVDTGSCCANGPNEPLFAVEGGAFFEASTAEAIAELGVPQNTFFNHPAYQS